MATATEPRMPRILVVDDSDDMRALLDDRLRGEGYLVDQAADVGGALQQLVRHAPDVILSDLLMPGLSGMDLLDTLRSRGSDVPVIVLTSKQEVAAAVEAMRAGASDYLTKPFDFSALELAILRVLHHREVRLEAENLRRSKPGSRC